jgi:membrane-bound ClpP family serine protease
MVEVGVALVLLGAALLVAEAHVPAGILGAGGGLSLTLGVILAMTASGAGAAAIVAVTVGVGGIAFLWLTIATRKSLAALGRRPRAGSEALSGRSGVVRTWNGTGGQVLLDGAIWSARRSWPDADDDDEDEHKPESLEPGDAVVVERVSGLTLAVRKAERWESLW